MELRQAAAPRWRQRAPHCMKNFTRPIRRTQVDSLRRSTGRVRWRMDPGELRARSPSFGMFHAIQPTSSGRRARFSSLDDRYASPRFLRVRSRPSRGLQWSGAHRRISRGPSELLRSGDEGDGCSHLLGRRRASRAHGCRGDLSRSRGQGSRRRHTGDSRRRATVASVSIPPVPLASPPAAMDRVAGSGSAHGRDAWDSRSSIADRQRRARDEAIGRSGSARQCWRWALRARGCPQILWTFGAGGVWEVARSAISQGRLTFHLLQGFQ